MGNDKRNGAPNEDSEASDTMVDYLCSFWLIFYLTIISGRPYQIGYMLVDDLDLCGTQSHAPKCRYQPMLLVRQIVLTLMAPIFDPTSFITPDNKRVQDAQHRVFHPAIF